MDQAYDQYSEADHRMWNQLFSRQMQQLPFIASRAYLEGIDKVGFVADHIPDFNQETNPKLKALTDWEVYTVPGLIPHIDFYTHLNHRQFPATNWLRKPEQLDYLEEPDMFHDTFGHVPLLTNSPFCQFLADLSDVALKYIDDADVLQRISRLYWYTVEFGLIEEDGKIKIYGGGILSSPGESLHCLRAHIRKVRFDTATIMDTPYHIDRYQDLYFVISAYEQLYGCVSKIEDIIAESRVA